MEDYKKIYENYFGIKIPSGFDIHHLNLSHSDNRIENLLMLPYSVHMKYHELRPQLQDLTVNVEITSINNSGHNSNLLFFDYFEKFLPVYNECCYWKDYKEFLLGNIPNIHNINL